MVASSLTPHMSAAELCKRFGVSKSAAAARANMIRVRQAGLCVDPRTAPGEIQQEAFRLGLIPFLPGQAAADHVETKAGIMASRLEEIAAWCAHSTRLASIRRRAKRQFFGTDAARTEYWPGSGGRNARQRALLAGSCSACVCQMAVDWRSWRPVPPCDLPLWTITGGIL
jgi:hypothetical protein